jgi:glutaredoxin
MSTEHQKYTAKIEAIVQALTKQGIGRDVALSATLMRYPPGGGWQNIETEVAAHTPAPREADVIVYKTEWCGVCKQLTAYLDRKGVKYVAKDIEKDSAAAGELRAKAEQKHVKTGSVPIIDVRGELLVGFDRNRLEQLL